MVPVPCSTVTRCSPYEHVRLGVCHTLTMTLLRRHIAQRLGDYYAQPSNFVVGAPLQTVDFQNLLGEWHWRRIYQKLYDEQHGQWLTPIELFSPYYSQVLAEYCAKQQTLSLEEFEIVELGGGRGTNAMGILSHLQRGHPDVYRRLAGYTIIDSSPSLHQLQKEVLLKSEHSSKVNFLEKDLTDVAESKTTLLSTVSETPTIFLALELLDNLGHDKVRKDETGFTLENAVIENSQEIFIPLSDPLLKRVLCEVPDYGGKGGIPRWVPTVACGVMMEIAKTRPNRWLLLADFDLLPPPDLKPGTLQRKTLEAEWEPIVTDMDGIDHDCYLNSPPLVDILFPTDFVNLSRFATKVFTGDNVTVMKQKQFLLDVGPSQVQATKGRWTGYSPMIEDFYNCSVLTVSCGDSKTPA